MARIIHWIQNESLAHFRTSIYPQLTSAPFSEQLILTVNLLIGNDLFSNAVQFFYLLGLVLAITLVAKQLGLAKFGQLLSAFILICIPEVILLSSSTHNEIALSFFMVLGIYFLIKTLKEQNVCDFLFLGCCLGLATATKHTAYLYISSFIVGWILIQVTQLIRKKQQVVVWPYLVLVGSFVLINASHYARNYELTANFFGSDETTTAYYVNEKHSLKMMVSNVTRNMSSQFGVPKIAPVAAQFTRSVHQLLDMDVNDPAITSHRYSVDPLATHENNGANPFHMTLLLLSLVWIVVTIKKRSQAVFWYAAAVVLSFIVFCFYLKWQPWAKLHVPFFIFYSVVIAHFLITVVKIKLIRTFIVIGFMMNALLILLFNYSRPFITLTPFTSEIKMTDDRYKKYFSRFLQCHEDFKVVNEIITLNNFKNIGLVYGNLGMEYQLFLDAYRSDKKPTHINAYQSCSFFPVSGPVDCLVSKTNKAFIEYDGKVFYNKTPANDGYLYLFLEE
jgi:4-amino-4-deoxy-L-arabinose transferase-like glycosyltransferase